MKNVIREANKEKRRNMTKQEAAAKSAAASEIFITGEIYKNADTIMFYMPIGNETDTSAIMKLAFKDGKQVVLPVTNPDSGEITPCYVTAETCFEKGAFSINEPVEKNVADKEKIDVVVVPGIAFDRKGNRVGFGKGCYDRFLSECRALKVGYCYDLQICDDIPADVSDIKMDFIITENGITECK